MRKQLAVSNEQQCRFVNSYLQNSLRNVVCIALCSAMLSAVFVNLKSTVLFEHEKINSLE